MALIFPEVGIDEQIDKERVSVMKQIKKNISRLVKVFMVVFLANFFLAPQHDAEQSAVRGLLIVGILMVSVLGYKAWKNFSMDKAKVYMIELKRRMGIRKMEMS